MMGMYSFFFQRPHQIENKMRVIKKMRAQVTRLYMTNMPSFLFPYSFSRSCAIIRRNTQLYVESLHMKKP